MKHTALHILHLDLGAKMAPFAGYDMPLYYKEGAIAEHEWVRNSCGLFDVSHMGQAMLNGPGAMDLMHKLTPSWFEKTPADRTKYTVLLNEQGGIVDDMMVTKLGDDHFHFVLNAGCKDKDMAWIKENMSVDQEFTYFGDWSLLALQGQKAEQVMREVLNIDLSDLNYMSLWAQDDYKMFINRLGYTGEDGFEIAVPNDAAEELAKKLLAHEAVKPVGLAARDSLRLEMGYALYGHEIGEETGPIEAGLGWVVSKNNNSCFNAAEIQRQKAEGTTRTMAGIQLREKGIARDGTEIQDESGAIIGALTSGGYSPVLKAGIGQGYIEAEKAAPGTQVFAVIRGKQVPAEIVALPHIAAKTKTAAKKKAAA